MPSILALRVTPTLLSCAGVKTGTLLATDASTYAALYAIDVDNGQPTWLFSLPSEFAIGGMAVSPDGLLYGAAWGIDQLVILDTETRDIIFVGPFGFSSVTDLGFAPDGTLYGFDDSSNQLITIDPQTGSGTAVGLGPSSGTGLTFTSDGALYLVGNPIGGPLLYLVNAETGAATEIGPLEAYLDYAYGLEVIGDVIYSSAYSNFGPPYYPIVTVDRETGLATVIDSGDDKGDPFLYSLAFLPGAGDADRDGDVDGDDVQFFIDCFGSLDQQGKSPYCRFLDDDKDGNLDCPDWTAFIANWTEDDEAPGFSECDCRTPPCPAACEGDSNGDGAVDPLDAGFVLSRLGCAVGSGDLECDSADANADHTVDPLDVGYVLARFGECP